VPIFASQTYERGGVCNAVRLEYILCSELEKHNVDPRNPHGGSCEYITSLGRSRTGLFETACVSGSAIAIDIWRCLLVWMRGIDRLFASKFELGSSAAHAANETLAQIAVADGPRIRRQNPSSLCVTGLEFRAPVEHRCEGLSGPRLLQWKGGPGGPNA
jgi:hypothetical protein